MRKYEYPKEVSEENFKELVVRAREINTISSINFVATIILTFGIFVLIASLFLSPIQSIQDKNTRNLIGLITVLGLTLFTTFFLVDIVHIGLRLIFKKCVPYYPLPEEFVFAQCILIANLINEKSRLRAIRKATFLSSEFSNYIKFSSVNNGRRLY